MPAPRLTVFIAIVVTALGLVAYEARTIARQSDELHRARPRHEMLAAQLRELRQQNEATANALTAARQEVASLEAGAAAQTGADRAAATDTRPWLARFQAMKRLLVERPDLGIPELQLLSDSDWLRVTREARLDTEVQVHKSLAALRDAAKEQFVGQLSFALRKYLAATDGQLPPTVIALAPYFDQPIDAAIFQRYEMLRAGNVREMPDRRLAVIREKTAINEDYDSRYGLDGNAVRMGGGNNARTWIADSDGYDAMVRRAQTEFARANNGANAAGLEQLAPYINPPLAQVKLQKLIDLERELKR